jgi:hypothetical protein
MYKVPSPFLIYNWKLFRSNVKLMRARRTSQAFAARSSGGGSMAAPGEKKSEI